MSLSLACSFGSFVLYGGFIDLYVWCGLALCVWRPAPRKVFIDSQDGCCSRWTLFCSQYNNLLIKSFPPDRAVQTVHVPLLAASYVSRGNDYVR